MVGIVGFSKPQLAIQICIIEKAREENHTTDGHCYVVVNNELEQNEAIARQWLGKAVH